MDAQRRAASGKPPSMAMISKKRPFGSDLTGSSARGSEDRSSVAPQPPRGTKRGREIEGIDKVRSFFSLFGLPKGVLAALGWPNESYYTHCEEACRGAVSSCICHGSPIATPDAMLRGRYRCVVAPLVSKLIAHALRSGVPRRPCLDLPPQICTTIAHQPKLYTQH